MTRIITEQEFVDATRRVIAERGLGFRYSIPDGYSSCRYVADGEESCLYGAVLFSAFGLQYDADYEGTPISHFLSGINPLDGDVVFDVSPGVVRAAYESQRSQDNATIYDEVLDEFDALAAGYDWSVLDKVAVDDEGAPVDRSLWSSR